MADNSKEIASLEALLNASAKSVSTDGVSASIGLEDARKRLNELRSTDDASIAAGKVRPMVLGAGSLLAGAF